MIKEELEKEAEEKAINFANKQDCLKGEWIDEEFSYGKIIAVYEQAYLAGSEPRERRIAELELENVELKKQLEMSNKVYNDNLDYSHHIEGQLTKAKDHIKKLLDCLKQDTNDPQTNYYVCQYMDKAEQFLKSEVEK